MGVCLGTCVPMLLAIMGVYGGDYFTRVVFKFKNKKCKRKTQTTTERNKTINARMRKTVLHARRDSRERGGGEVVRSGVRSGPGEVRSKSPSESHDTTWQIMTGPLKYNNIFIIITRTRHNTTHATCRLPFSLAEIIGNY